MILILNCGSQSIKWKVFDAKLKAVKEGRREVLDSKDFEKILEEELNKIVKSDFTISKIGHRVVHGKNLFCEPIKITDDVVKKLELLNYLAPLHNPFNVLGIKTCQNVFGDISQFAVFDTEFFRDLPEVAYTYALSEKIVQEFGYRKYGFHGISHEYVFKKTLEKNKKYKKVITVHFGGGASITAIKNGRAVDTSMGFTPMKGLVIMTSA